MKRKILIPLALVVTASFIMAPLIFAKSENEGESYWFNVKITDMKTNKEKLTIRMPLAVIEWAEQFTKEIDKDDFDINIDKGCKFDLKKLVEILKKSKDQFLIKIEDFEDNQRIELWID